MSRLDKLTKELFDDPTFPLLYISKTTEMATLAVFGYAPKEAAAIMALTSLPALAFWYYLGDRVEETVDEVTDAAD